MIPKVASAVAFPRVPDAHLSIAHGQKSAISMTQDGHKTGLGSVTASTATVQVQMYVGATAR